MEPDESMKSFEALAAFSDLIGAIVELAGGYRAKAIEAGFGPEAADAIGVQLHERVLDHILKQASGA
jgi:hypothetical protein